MLHLIRILQKQFNENKPEPSVQLQESSPHIQKQTDRELGVYVRD